MSVVNSSTTYLATLYSSNPKLKQEPFPFQMCDEVTEIQCDVVPYTECKMEMAETPFKSYDMEQQIYRRKSCTEGMDVVQHTKMMPECRNVTKQNCITKWETDDDGNQVSQSDTHPRVLFILSQIIGDSLL